MINNISVQREATNVSSNKLNFSDYKNEISAFTLVGENEASILASQLNAIGESIHDEKIVAALAEANSIDAKKLQLAVTIIKSKSGNSQLSSTVATPEGTLTEETTKVETPDQTIARLTRELSKSKSTLKSMEPAVVKLELATNPGKIPQYLRQKMRDKKLSRKSRSKGGISPYETLYTLQEGSMRRFRTKSGQERNAEKIYQTLKKKYGPDAQANETFIPQRLEMEKRWEMIEEAHKRIQGVKAMDVNL